MDRSLDISLWIYLSGYISGFLTSSSPVSAQNCLYGVIFSRIRLKVFCFLALICILCVDGGDGMAGLSQKQVHAGGLKMHPSPALKIDRRIDGQQLKWTENPAHGPAILWMN